MNPLVPTDVGPSTLERPQSSQCWAAASSSSSVPAASNLEQPFSLPDSAGEDGHNWDPYAEGKEAEQWQMMGYLIGWSETARRCGNEATTLGVVSALLAGITFPGLMQPPTVSEDDFSGPVSSDTLLRLFMYFTALSVLCSLVCVILCCTLLMQLNILCSDLDIRDFFAAYHKLTTANVASFNLSLACFIGSTGTVLALKHTWIDAIIVVAIFLFVWFLLGAFIGKLYMGFSMAHLSSKYRAFIKALVKVQGLKTRVHPRDTAETKAEIKALVDAAVGEAAKQRWLKAIRAHDQPREEPALDDKIKAHKEYPLA